MGNNDKKVVIKKSNKGMFIGIGVIVILVVAFFIVKTNFSSNNDIASQGSNITITKSDITEVAKFIPYKAGNTKMEVIAVKAPDGSVRTAFNTCQVCYDSGRGYYKQEGDELVCQNCGNRFNISQVEIVKGGCNPVPILKENKSENETTITISKDFLALNEGLFGNWNKE